MAPIRVLGLGNVLMNDDGFGPFVIEHLLAAYDFPPEVEVPDVGTPGLDLTPYLADADAVVIVDTVKSRGEPGELRTYRRAEILAKPPEPRVSPHDPGLKDTLFTLTLAGMVPHEVFLVGAIPGDVSMGASLTPSLLAAVPRAAAEVVAELVRLGASPVPRPDRPPASPWWTADPTR
jgi:hydrogenase maturation protease